MGAKQEQEGEKPGSEVSFFDWLVPPEEQALLAKLREAPARELLVYVALSLSKLTQSVDYLGDRLADIGCDLENIEQHTRPERP